ncbi:ankyrin repeat domain-containing protein [Rickettsiella endosymbiont of Rhagonycha lignosa]|uniref:ankyrin repeat domain-containing protein n=1 Tax=Rickettsiella endosymbiont of Rhagonycha lignosa TaxID=3077937 RepID=UPI00313B84CB
MSSLLDTIKDVLANEIPNNTTGCKVTLSVGEILLLVLTVCKKNKVNDLELNQFYQLYLEGVKTEADRELIKEIEKVITDKCFVIKSDSKTINDDPIRRYFETNLAYHILQNNAETLDHAKLENFTQCLKSRLFSLQNVKPSLSIVEKILKGDLDGNVLNKYELEYAELTHKLLKNDFYGLSEVACKNLYQIACSTILATLNTQNDESMPANIYSHSIFTMGMDGRGRFIKPFHNEVRTTAKGLMKSISPLPMYHDVVNPVEESYENVYSPFQRSADQSDYMIESQWSQRLFSRQTQVYSNGISSTTLAQIRNMILQRRLGSHDYNISFKHYMTVFASLMLYNSGGHSFFEIFEVFKLPFCAELMEDELDIQEALKNDKLMFKLLYEDQKDAFEQALQSTQFYANRLLNKKLLNAEFKKQRIKDDSDLFSISEEKMTLHHAVINLTADELHKRLDSSDDEKANIDSLNHKGWTALMVAAQLGKVDHVNELLAAKSNIGRQANCLSALELAIKSENYNVVLALLSAGAVVKRKNTSLQKLYKTSPAMYLACRQRDMRILEALLHYKNKFNFEDIKKALLIALQAENFEAIRVLVNYINQHLEKNDFSEDYKFLLLKKAITLGSLQFIQNIKSLLFPSTNRIDYSTLLYIAATKGFLPIAGYLLKLSNSHISKLENKEPTFSIDFNKLLLTALKNNHFAMAVFLIIAGANPAAIPINSSCFMQFSNYLLDPKLSEFLFTEVENELIAKRIKDIGESLQQRESGVFHDFLTRLVSFLNKILPNNWRLGYNDKTLVMRKLSLLFTSKNPVEIASIEHPLESPIKAI